MLTCMTSSMLHRQLANECPFSSLVGWLVCANQRPFCSSYLSAVSLLVPTGRLKLPMRLLIARLQSSSYLASEIVPGRSVNGVH